MRCAFITFVLFAFAQSSAFARPSDSTLHFLSKRDFVCGLDFRKAVIATDCIGGSSFTQDGATVKETPSVTVSETISISITLGLTPP
jgi:hypothetical protein